MGRIHFPQPARPTDRQHPLGIRTMEFRISLTPRLSIFLMLFSLVFLVLISLIGYELGYREGQRHEAQSIFNSKAPAKAPSEAVGPETSEPNKSSNAVGMQR